MGVKRRSLSTALGPGPSTTPSPEAAPGHVGAGALGCSAPRGRAFLGARLGRVYLAGTSLRRLGLGQFREGVPGVAEKGTRGQAGQGGGSNHRHGIAPLVLAPRFEVRTSSPRSGRNPLRVAGAQILARPAPRL